MAALSIECAAQELCAEAKAMRPPKPPPGADRPDACEAVAFVTKAAQACAAELPEDRAMQRHAAGLLELERTRRIRAMTLDGLRQHQAHPERMPGIKSDPAILQRQIEELAGQVAKMDAELATKRQAAIAAGYARFAEGGFAQRVIGNAVWRMLLADGRRALEGCARDEAGRRAAAEYAAGLAAMASHGNPFEREALRRIDRRAEP